MGNEVRNYWRRNAVTPKPTGTGLDDFTVYGADTTGPTESLEIRLRGAGCESRIPSLQVACRTHPQCPAA